MEYTMVRYESWKHGFESLLSQETCSVNLGNVLVQSNQSCKISKDIYTITFHYKNFTELVAKLNCSLPQIVDNVLIFITINTLCLL